MWLEGIAFVVFCDVSVFIHLSCKKFLRRETVYFKFIEKVFFLDASMYNITM